MYRGGLILFFLILFPLSAFSSENATEPFNAFVLPEVTTQVDMSSSDINRIVCPVDIKDVIFSKEKGLSVKIAGRGAFVKFLITKKEDKEIYSNTPSELFVICGNDVYSLIVIPKRIPSQTIRLSSGKLEKIKKNISLMEGLPFEKKVTVKNDSPHDSLHIMEKDFLRTEITERPVAISIDKLNLKKGDSGRLFIVEQTVGDSERRLQ